MPLWRLVSVSGLTFGDYLLWNWSLDSNHNLIALLSGLTLPPLALAFLWLLILFLARLLARTTRVGSRQASRRAQPRPSQPSHGDGERMGAPDPDPRDSGKLAA